MFYKNNTFGKLKKKHEHRENGDMFQFIDGINVYYYIIYEEAL